MFNRSYILGHENHPHYFTELNLSALRDTVELSEADGELLNIIKALSDPTRYKIYLLLKQVKEISVSDISRILNLSQSSISHALSDLKILGIIEAHKCSKLICYSLKESKNTNKFKRFIDRFIKR